VEQGRAGKLSRMRRGVEVDTFFVKKKKGRGEEQLCSAQESNCKERQSALSFFTKEEGGDENIQEPGLIEEKTAIQSDGSGKGKIKGKERKEGVRQIGAREIGEGRLWQEGPPA